jgi:hypothetical protein
MSATPRSITEENFCGWPAVVLRQGKLTLSLVPQVGGRLMGISLGGQEIGFANPDLFGKTFTGDTAQWPALCGDWSFPLWGGGKSWVAPESAWPGGAPHRDLDSLAWTVTESWNTADAMGVEVQSPVCSQTGLQITRRLTLPADGTEWTIEHTLTNRGTASTTGGIWDVLMLKRPAVVTIPLAPEHAHSIVALPGKEPLAALQRDGVLTLREHNAQIRCSVGREFKCGFQSEQGQVDVQFPTLQVGYARHSTVTTGPYAHGHPLEVFNAPSLDYFEVETHSPLQTLAHGDSLRYSIHERIYLFEKETP